MGRRSRGMLALLAFAISAIAQESAPTGILRGDLEDRSGNARSGELIFRNADNRVYQCAYDDKTYFERENQRISAIAAEKGDPVEILSDRKLGTDVCYARTVQVLARRVARAAPGVRPRRPPISSSEIFGPRGDLTFAGVVLRLEADRLVLRTRKGEHKLIQLRSDTLYLTAGQSLERSALPLATRVFIRAGKNLDDKIEAFQVIWGDILEP